MSDVERSFTNFPAPMMEIPEMYNVTRKIGKEGDLKGYKVPETVSFLQRSHKFPVEKKKDMIYQISKRAKDPDCTMYSPTNEKLQKTYWSPKNGRFTKDRRMTITEEVMKSSSKIPGPSDYQQVPKGKSSSLPRALLGKFDKDKDSSYFNEILYQAEQSPGSSQYYSNLEDRDKAFSKLETKLPVFKYYPPKAKKQEEKVPVGPGYLTGLEESYHKRALSTRTPMYTIGKGKIVRKSDEIANCNKFVPGVGHYKDKEKAFTSFVLQHRDRMPFISKSKDIRFTEEFMKSKTWVPGPGSYELGPQIYSPKK